MVSLLPLNLPRTLSAIIYFISRNAVLVARNAGSYLPLRFTLLILPHISYATPLNNGAGAMAIPQMGQISGDPSGFSLEAVKLPRSSHFLNISGRDVQLDHPIGIEVGLQTE